LTTLSALSAYLPAGLLLLFTGGCGTFAGAARSGWAVVGHLALLAFTAAAGDGWRDPLRLGRVGRALVAALAVAAVASWWLSPVPRAGRVGLTLVPAYLLVPAVVERCWATAERRRRGLVALSLVVATIAAGALGSWWWLATPGASLPLGHHNLLATWLVTLGPLAVLPWRDRAPARLLAAVAALLALGALVATRSLMGLVALGMVLMVALPASRRRWVFLGGLLVAALLLVLATPRIRRIAAGTDPSAMARRGYLEAGWRGLRERPIFGWGPGAAHWTIGENLVPVPGVHPPDQVVTDLHALPLQLGYELGASGLVLAAGVGLVFLCRRLREIRAAPDPTTARAALLGLLGLAVASLGGMPLSVPALPLAAMLVAGALLAASQSSRTHGRHGRQGPRSAGGWLPVVLVIVLAALLVPVDLAHLEYDRARGAAAVEAQLRHLERAVGLDPAFPLYRMRWAALERERKGSSPEVARRARAAARDASGLAPFWLLAGILGQEAGQPGSEEALLRACRLNPLGALAPFRLAAGETTDPRAPRWAGRALLAEPLLLAAVDWQDRGTLIDAAVREVNDVEGVEHSWRRALGVQAAVRAAAGGATRRLVLEMDADAATALSLHAFRRMPWPVYLAEVRLSAALVAEIDLVPAAKIRTTDPGVFDRQHCGLRPQH